MKLQVEELETMVAPLSNAYWIGFLFVAGVGVLIISALAARKKGGSGKKDGFPK